MPSISKHKGDPIIDMLLQARKARGLRQQAVADKAAISRRALVSIEAGRDCTLSTLRRLCEALDVELEARPAPKRALVDRRSSNMFRTAGEASNHQADRELAEALRVQCLPPLEFARWLSSTWDRLQQDANRLYSGMPRPGAGHSRSFRTIEEKNRFDARRDTQFAIAVATRS
jgi:transcriptional regulator with XRE-family HTH domain